MILNGGSSFTIRSGFLRPPVYRPEKPAADVPNFSV